MNILLKTLLASLLTFTLASADIIGIVPSDSTKEIADSTTSYGSSGVGGVEGDVYSGTDTVSISGNLDPIVMLYDKMNNIERTLIKLSDLVFLTGIMICLVLLYIYRAAKIGNSDEGIQKLRNETLRITIIFLFFLFMFAFVVN